MSNHSNDAKLLLKYHILIVSLLLSHSMAPWQWPLHRFLQNIYGDKQCDHNTIFY
jgi:hypothetical protein